MQTTRVFECRSCHAKILEADRSARATEPRRAGEFAAVEVACPVCGAKNRYDVGAAQAGDSPESAVIPCQECDTVVEVYGTSPEFVEQVAEEPELHDLHRR